MTLCFFVHTIAKRGKIKEPLPSGSLVLSIFLAKFEKCCQ